MGSGGMIYLPSFIKIGSVIQKLMGGIHIQTYREHGELISLLSFFFFQNKEIMLKNKTVQQVNTVKYLGRSKPYEEEKGIDAIFLTRQHKPEAINSSGRHGNNNL
jgi:hypothetical protein